MDNSLNFLRNASNDDLKVLTDIITLDRDGTPRATETLTVMDSYTSNYPHNIRAFLPDLIDELEHFGGNTFVNIFRGRGVPYHTILRDVADKLKVDYFSYNSNEQIEKKILEKLLQEILDRASEKELRELLREIGDVPGRAIRDLKNLSPKDMTAILMGAFKLGGFRSYQLLVIIANSMAKFFLNRGLSLAANAALTRVASIFVGPAGWITMGVWTVVGDIAGPAYRVTIPTVVQIAYIREKEHMKKLKILSA